MTNYTDAVIILASWARVGVKTVERGRTVPCIDSLEKELLVAVGTLQSKEPEIMTRHFGKPMPLSTVLFALAGQEGNDGDEGNAMQAAAQYIKAQLGE